MISQSASRADGVNALSHATTVRSAGGQCGPQKDRVDAQEAQVSHRSVSLDELSDLGQQVTCEAAVSISSRHRVRVFVRSDAAWVS